RVGRVLQRGTRVPVVVEPEGADRARAREHDLAEQRVVGIRDERGLRQARKRRAPALRDVLELDVAVELVPAQIAEQDGTAVDAASGSAAATTAKSRSWATGEASRVDAIPDTRFAPDALCASRSRARRIAAVIAAVVVLPFVADTSTAPCGSSLASRSIAPGWAFHSTLPGSVVPPPAPKSRDVAPIPRARSRSSSSSTPRGYPRSSLARVNLRP